LVVLLVNLDLLLFKPCNALLLLRTGLGALECFLPQLVLTELNLLLLRLMFSIAPVSGLMHLLLAFLIECILTCLHTVGLLLLLLSHKLLLYLLFFPRPVSERLGDRLVLRLGLVSNILVALYHLALGSGVHDSCLVVVRLNGCLTSLHCRAGLQLSHFVHIALVRALRCCVLRLLSRNVEFAVSVRRIELVLIGLLGLDQ
jgi:hypothetical protein